MTRYPIFLLCLLSLSTDARTVRLNHARKKHHRRRTEDLNKAIIHSSTKSPTIIPSSLILHQNDFSYDPTSTTSLMTMSPTPDETVNYIAIPDENTGSPTSNMTNKPSTKEPPKNILDHPTMIPTTKKPSEGPTSSPIRNPTKNPSTFPSGGLTDSPTMSPTINLNYSPSSIPSINPTAKLTMNSTLHSDHNTTVSPSTSPTDSVTRNSIYFQIGGSTKNLLIRHTILPTSSPTSSHSEVPSLTLSTFPPLKPNSLLSLEPTTRKHAKKIEKSKHYSKSFKNNNFQSNIDINFPKLVGNIKIPSVKKIKKIKKLYREPKKTIKTVKLNTKASIKSSKGMKSSKTDRKETK